MVTGIWQWVRAAVAGWKARRATIATAPRPSAFQAALADDLRQLQGYAAALAGNRERLRRFHQEAVSAGVDGRHQAVAEFEALARQPQVSRDEVKRVFRRLAMQCHPDHGGSPRLFAKLYQSYQRMVGGGSHDVGRTA
jgi:hypothetical protein